MSLYACLAIPDFALAALLRAERRPCAAAVSGGEPPHQFVFAANEAARAGGVKVGMPRAEAEARWGMAGRDGRLRIEERNVEAEQKTQQQLLNLAVNITPRFEDAAPGLIVLDFAGLRDPHASATQLSYGAEKLGLQPNIGVSRNRFVALYAARTQSGVTHIYPGQEAGFLQAQPLGVLLLDEKEAQTLARWGITTVGELAKLSEDNLVERFGERGARMARLARGEQGAVLKAYEHPPELTEKLDFDWEVGELEPLSFLLSGLLENLCYKLQGHNLAAAVLRISLKLAGGGRFNRKLPLSYPLTDPRTLLTLIRLDLARNPPGDAIEGVTVAAEPTERRMMQFALFAPAAPSPEKLAVTLSRLTSLVGAERVGTPRAPDSHRPGALAVAEFVVRDKVLVRDKVQGIRGKKGVRTAVAVREPESCPLSLVPCPSLSRETLAFRCFRPSWAVEVLVRNGKPVYVDACERLSAPVVACAGPWRVAGEWWTPGGWQYEEWDVKLEEKLYRVCCDRPTGEWLLTGAYD